LQVRDENLVFHRDIVANVGEISYADRRTEALEIDRHDATVKADRIFLQFVIAGLRADVFAESVAEHRIDAPRQTGVARIAVWECRRQVDGVAQPRREPGRTWGVFGRPDRDGLRHEAAQRGVGRRDDRRAQGARDRLVGTRDERRRGKREQRAYPQGGGETEYHYLQ